MDKVIKCPQCSQRFQVPAEEYHNFICSNCGIELQYNSHLKPKKQKVDNIKHENQDYFFINFIVYILSLLITIPLFIIFHKLLPNPDLAFHIDRIILGISLIAITILMLKQFKWIVFGASVVCFIFLLYGTLWGNYGFNRIYKDYLAMIYTINNSPKLNKISVPKSKALNTQLKSAIDFSNPDVRNFALTATTKHFEEFAKNSDESERKLIQYFAIFKEINSQWNYADDPSGQEYFAKASETVKHLSGDCDDHSILMVACIKAIGGTTRLIHTTGHLYPELLIESENDLETANYLINQELFVAESANSNGLHYHTDNDGHIWLNLDYTAHYPGAPFMDDNILEIIDNFN